MKITTFGHSCLLIEEEELKILIDPGNFSSLPDTLDDLAVILITHEHQDHLDIELLRAILAKNKNAKIYTNPGVSLVLEQEEIPHMTISDGKSIMPKNVLIEAIGKEHATIYPTITAINNVGFRIAEKFFYPGDAFTLPEKEIDVLALPVAGPWLKLLESINYAKAIHPRVCFPVHDGTLKFPGTVHQIPPLILEPLGIQWVVLEPGQEMEV